MQNAIPSSENPFLSMGMLCPGVIAPSRLDDVLSNLSKAEQVAYEAEEFDIAMLHRENSRRVLENAIKIQCRPRSTKEW